MAEPPSVGWVPVSRFTAARHNGCERRNGSLKSPYFIGCPDPLPGGAFKPTPCWAARVSRRLYGWCFVGPLHTPLHKASQQPQISPENEWRVPSYTVENKWTRNSSIKLEIRCSIRLSYAPSKAGKTQYRIACYWGLDGLPAWHIATGNSRNKSAANKQGSPSAD